MRPRFAALAAVCIVAHACAQPDGPFLHPADAAPERRFDFWLGQWDVHNRFIAEDGTERVVEAEALIWPALDGQVVVEHWRSLSHAWPMRGFSMRSYDPETDRWTIALCWPGEGPAKINLMEGRFRNGRAEFFPASTPDGERPRSRFTFSDVGPNSLRWDMALPVEGDERAWRTTWVMEWTRRAPDDPIDLAALHGDGARENHAMDWMVGDWLGWVGGPEPVATPVIDTFSARPILAGRAMLVSIADYDPVFSDPGVRRVDGETLAREWLGLLTWDREAEVWRYCDVESSGAITRSEGVIEDGALTLVSEDGLRRIVARRADPQRGFTWSTQRRDAPDEPWTDGPAFVGDRRLTAPDPD